jgi:hypothetical protein
LPSVAADSPAQTPFGDGSFRLLPAVAAALPQGQFLTVACYRSNVSLEHLTGENSKPAGKRTQLSPCPLVFFGYPHFRTHKRSHNAFNLW